MPGTRICIPALLATLCLAAGVFAGAAAGQPVRSELTLLERLDGLLVRQQIMFDKQARLARAEVVIAFPQRDVHLDTSSPLQLAWASKETSKERAADEESPS